MVEREGFEPSKAWAARFTVWSLWPLGYLSASKLSNFFIEVLNSHPSGFTTWTDPDFTTTFLPVFEVQLPFLELLSNEIKRLLRKMELEKGLEPTTCGLQNRCSTNWATPAFQSPRFGFLSGLPTISCAKFHSLRKKSMTNVKFSWFQWVSENKSPGS